MHVDASQPNNEGSSDSKELTIVRSKQPHVRYVPINVIAKKIAPVSSQSIESLSIFIAKFDLDGKGGLSEKEWLKFCRENRQHFTSLGEELIDYDPSSEYVVLTVQSEVHYEEKKSIIKGTVRFLEGFAAGGIAGAVSKTVIAPGDRVKIIFQVDSKRCFSLFEAAKLGLDTTRRYGLLGLWIGNGATIMRVFPYAAITYVSFDYYERGLRYVWHINNENIKEHEGKAVMIRFISGAFAGATSTLFTYPLDLMRARFAANSTEGKGFPSYNAAYRVIVAEHGLKSLYFGIFPTLVGIMPYAGCSFAAFETIKHYIVVSEGLQSDKEISTSKRLIAGGFAGLLGQSATYPLDIVRRRMQVTPGRYHGVWHALHTIAKEEGIRKGLYKGLSMNWIKGPIAVATSFTVNDVLKRRMCSYYEAASISHQRRAHLVSPPEALLCGGLAAGVAKIWAIPFDKLRIKYQVEKTFSQQGIYHSAVNNSNNNISSFSIISELNAMRPHLWKGGDLTMLRVVPYGAFTYCFYDMLQPIWERLLFSHEPNVMTNFFAGATAASIATTLVYPLDLMRARAATNTLPRSFQSYYWLFRDMSKKNGLKCLWEGCFVAISGAGPMAGLGFAVYEEIKRKYQCDTFFSRLLAGMGAGLFGIFLTYPMSVARRQKQVEGLIHSSFLDAKKSIKHPELYSLLYKRMPFAWSLGAMSFGISFALNDALRDLMVKARREILRDLVFKNN